MNNKNFEDIYTLKEGLLIVVSGPSGAGKSVVCKEYVNAHKDDTVLSISETTRAIRSNETPDVDYVFIDEDLYKKRLAEDYYLESANVHGNYYGTPKEKILNYLKEGKDVILEIDYQGANLVKKIVPSLITVFVLPTNYDILVDMIRGRGTESEEAIKRRLQTAENEIIQVPNYDYVIINRRGELDKTVDDLAAIITAEKHNVKRILDQTEGE